GEASTGMRFTGSRVGLPLAGNAVLLLLARWWLPPAEPASSRRAPPLSPRPARWLAGAPAAAAPAAAPAAAHSPPFEAAELLLPLADCRAAVGAREAARACSSPCPPCPSCEAGSGPRHSLAGEAARCGRPSAAGLRLAHKLVVVALSSRGLDHYADLTPGFDVYAEEYDAGNAGVRNWWREWGPAAAPLGAVTPAGLRHSDLAAMPTVAQLAQACARGTAKMADQERDAGAGSAAAVPAPGVAGGYGAFPALAAAAGGAPLGGSIAAGAPAAAGGTAAAAPAPAPATAAGAASAPAAGGLAGPAARVAAPRAAGGDGAVAAAPPAVDGGAAARLGDFRTLATACDVQGPLHREFRDCVQLVRPTSLPDRDVPGPATYHWVTTYQVENGGSPMGRPQAWKAALGWAASVNDPIVSLHHEFSKIMQKGYTDKLGCSRSPDSGGHEQFFFVGMRSARGFMVWPALSEWISAQLAADSAIAKERREA
ncbi:unnamed protein product, partial [Prorocentrum cordatum]